MISFPWEDVVTSVVKEYASEWYRLGEKLGYYDGHIPEPILNSPIQATIDTVLCELGDNDDAWKELKIGIGTVAQDVWAVELEAGTPGEQPWKMIWSWCSKKRRELPAIVDSILDSVHRIRKKEPKRKQGEWLCFM